jgi:Protein of unknown function (DUF1272)
MLILRKLFRVGLLELRPNCECCNKDLPPDTTDAMICSFECPIPPHPDGRYNAWQLRYEWMWPTAPSVTGFYLLYGVTPATHSRTVWQSQR